jgi:hypothetical protein
MKYRILGFWLIASVLSGSSTQIAAQEPAVPAAPPIVVQEKPSVVPRQSNLNESNIRSIPAIEALPNSQQSPFTILPGETAGNGNGSTFGGFDQYQDLGRLLPGNFKDTKYKWYGFIRVDGIYDFKPISGTDSFVTAGIPVPQGKGRNTVLTPRYTRLGFDTETPLPVYDWTLKTRIELDFFNGNNSGSFGSFPLRLRFAWADFGPFRFGQDSTQFMDFDTFPNVIDYQGPPGMILMRQPGVSVRIPLAEKLRMAFAVEQPFSDISFLDGTGNLTTVPGSGVVTTAGVQRGVQQMPDFTSHMRYEGDYGHLQAAGIARLLTYQAPNTNQSDQFGYGGSFTGSFHPWAAINNTPRSGDDSTALSKSRFLWQYAGGRGINRYFQDSNGFGLDAAFTPGGGFEAIASYGWFVAYEQWWNKKLLSNFTYSALRLDLPSVLPGNTYKQGQYATANLIWLPIPRLGMGIELLYGTRENLSGGKGEAFRLQSGVQYKF